MYLFRFGDLLRQTNEFARNILHTNIYVPKGFYIFLGEKKVNKVADH